MKDRFTPKKEIAGKDPADIIAEKQHSKTILVIKENTDEKHRVSLNLPKDKYEIVRKKAKGRGLTLTAYIITLINSDIEIA
jgi:predicted DNA binding CopG/RHH family protein